MLESAAASGPRPSADLILISVFVQAHLATLSTKRAARFLDAAKATMDRHRDLAELPRIRPTARDAELAEAVGEASAWLRSMMPTFRAVAGVE
ncbi:MAG: hypothetical protein ACREEW_19155 [Caulobacteraceae bacterium]